MTVFTDSVLVVASLLFGLALLRRAGLLRQNSIRLWGWAFLALAVAAFGGAVTHGFAPHMSEIWLRVCWTITVYAIGVATFFMLGGTVYGSFPPILASWLSLLLVIKLLVFLVWMWVHPDFVYVIYDYGPSMILVALIFTYGWWSRRDRAAGPMILGVAVSFAAAAAQQSSLQLGPFNHNDIYHVIQLFGNWFFYQGAGELRDG